MTTGVIDTGTNLQLASLTSVANLPLVHLTLAVNFPPVSTTPAVDLLPLSLRPVLVVYYLEFQISSQTKKKIK
jgi:hypothetical protein